MATFRKLPSGKYLFEIRRRGHPYMSKAFATKKAGDAWAAEIERDINDHVFLDRLQEASAPTVAELLGQYEKEISPRKKGSSKEAYRLRSFQSASFASKRVSQVTSGDLETWRDKRLQKVKPDTVNRDLMLLSSFFTQCGKGKNGKGGWNHIKSNPMESVVIPKAGVRRQRRVHSVIWPGRNQAVSEVEAIAEATGSAELGSFVFLAMESGMRRGEQVRVMYEDVVTDKGITSVQLHEGKTKNDEPRRVVLTPNAAAIVAKLLESKSRGKRLFALKPDSYTQSFSRARERARERYLADCAAHEVSPDPTFLVGIRLHDQRHEATSNYLDVYGLDVGATAKQVGHKSTKMLMTYYHPDAREIGIKMAAHAQREYPVVILQGDSDYTVSLPDVPGIKMNVDDPNRALDVAKMILNAQETRPSASKIEDVRKKNPGALVISLKA